MGEVAPGRPRSERTPSCSAPTWRFCADLTCISCGRPMATIRRCMHGRMGWVLRANALVPCRATDAFCSTR